MLWILLSLIKCCEFILTTDVTAIMKKIIIAVLMCLPMALLAEEVGSVKSPQHRVALLELYTSEGCSSCPPADRFLSELKAEGISDQQLIPMAFHVTYWDFIGWEDRFAKKQFDQRQRERASKNKLDTVYTPQFVFSGEDYRGFASFSDDLNTLVKQRAKVDMALSADKQGDKLQLHLKSDISRSNLKKVHFYFVLIENNLSSDVNDGENEGVKLQHNYVVREILGPHFQLQKTQSIELRPEWKKQDLSIVAFAENPHTGEVLQAVRLPF